MFSCLVLGKFFNEEALDTKTTNGKRSDRGIGEEGRRKKKRQNKKGLSAAGKTGALQQKRPLFENHYSDKSNHFKEF